MPITDSLAIRIKAETGQTVITDNIASLAVSGGIGTASLVNDATYGNLWRITGGAKTAALSGMGAFTASVTTIAVRFRVTNRGDNYTQHFLMGSDSGTGLDIQNSGTATGSFRVTGLGGGTPVITVYPLYTSNTVKTFVFRFTEGATDYTDLWINTTGRVGVTPDYATSGAFSFGGVRARAYLQFLAATETLDVLDYAMWTRGLTDAESASVADDIRTVIYATDTTAPTLTSPTGTQTGATTASGTVTTSEMGGTLYWMASANATELLATVKAGSSQAVSALSQSVTVTGLTASTTYYLHYAHTDASVNDSAVVTSASFTTGAAGDTIIPVMTGTLTSSAITSSGFTLSWATATDNVGVTGYEYSTDNGSIYTSAGLVLTKAITGLIASTLYNTKVRAFDAAGNRAVAQSLAVTTASVTGTITSPVLKNNTGTILANESGVVVNVYNASTGALVLHKTGLTSNTSGIVTFTDAALSAATSYAYEVVLSGGRRRLPLVTTT